MGQREDSKILSDLRKSGAKIYSISRLNTMNTCPYQAYLNYVLGVEGKNKGIYGILGGKVHDVLEGCIKGEKTPEDIKPAIESELMDLEMFGIEFPLDRNGNPTIRNNWIANMTKFAEEFKTPKGNFDTEQLIIYPLGNNRYMQGYVDAIRHNSDGSVWLLDWKTSTNFTGDHLIEAGRQLVLYKLALEREGYTVKKASWVMLKYCETEWKSYVKKTKSYKTNKKVSQWKDLIKDLSTPIETALEATGKYGEIEIDFMLEEGIQKNSWEVFPPEIQSQFKTRVYVRDYEIGQDEIDETLSYINKMIEKYETFGEIESNYHPCNIEKQSFFCNSLCNFGGKSGQCKFYEDYKAQFVSKDEEEDLF